MQNTDETTVNTDENPIETDEAATGTGEATNDTDETTNEDGTKAPLNNGDTNKIFIVNGQKVRGLGSFHKSLPHDKYGEVVTNDFDKLVAATQGKPNFQDVPKGTTTNDSNTAPLVNPRAGLENDRLTSPPKDYHIPPAPPVLSITTAAEMVELYWMAVLRDVPFDQLDAHPLMATATKEIGQWFANAVADKGVGRLQTGFDVPGCVGQLAAITPKNIFRLGLPGEEVGPLVSQFFVRDISFGTQTIGQRQRPYTTGKNYLTKFEDWFHAQQTGNGDDGVDYRRSNELKADYYEPESDIRFFATMRDVARFVNKDALHQAYFNAALLLLSDGAKWTPGNPYVKGGPLSKREAGFGTLGGPHILALVSEVATRALKVVWYQKWQTHLRLRPEAYGGLVHVQNEGSPAGKRAYGLPAALMQTAVIGEIKKLNAASNGKGAPTSLLLPMAFTAGSPLHPAYGAGHATVAGACVTVLKAYFKTFDEAKNGKVTPIPIQCKKGDPQFDDCLMEREFPYSDPKPFETFITGTDNPVGKNGVRDNRKTTDPKGMTIEGELNKLATNVAMGRTMGGVHWRTDNARSLTLGEALAARILADITKDLQAEKPQFVFRTFARDSTGEPKIVCIQNGCITVDGKAPASDSALFVP